MSYYEKYPLECPTINKWIKQGVVKILKKDLSKLNKQELCCVLVYTARGYVKDVQNGKIFRFKNTYNNEALKLRTSAVR